MSLVTSDLNDEIHAELDNEDEQMKCEEDVDIETDKNIHEELDSHYENDSQMNCEDVCSLSKEDVHHALDEASESDINVELKKDYENDVNVKSPKSVLDDNQKSEHTKPSKDCENDIEKDTRETSKGDVFLACKKTSDKDINFAYGNLNIKVEKEEYNEYENDPISLSHYEDKFKSYEDNFKSFIKTEKDIHTKLEQECEKDVYIEYEKNIHNNSKNDCDNIEIKTEKNIDIECINDLNDTTNIGNNDVVIKSENNDDVCIKSEKDPYTEYENLHIEPKYDGVVMLSQDSVFFDDACIRSDGRKIFHIFEEATNDLDVADNAPYKISEERKYVLCEKASENTFENVQKILERNGISLDEWCPPLTERCQNSLSDSCDSTQNSEKHQRFNQNIGGVGIDDGETLGGVNDNLGKENRGHKEQGEESNVTSSEAQEVCKCDHCDYFTLYKSKLDSHLLTHSLTKRYRCATCNYETNRLGWLNRHKMKFPGHKEANMKKSPPDVEKGVQNSSLRTVKEENVFTEHSVDSKGNLSYLFPYEKEDATGNWRTFQCNICNYRTVYKGNLKSHMLVHSSVKRFKCLSCTYGTNYAYCVKTHKMKYPDHKFHETRTKSLESFTDVKPDLNITIGKTEYKLKCPELILSPVKITQGAVIDYTSSLNTVAVNMPNHNTAKAQSPIPCVTSAATELKDILLEIPRTDGEASTDLKNNINHKLNIEENGKERSLPSPETASVITGLKFTEKLGTEEIESPIDLSTTIMARNNNTNIKSDINKAYNIKFVNQKYLFESLQCPFASPSKYMVKRHEKIHQLNRTRSCKECDFTANCLYSLNMHKKVHSKSKVITCESCSFRTSNKKTYLMHITKHNVPVKRSVMDVVHPSIEVQSVLGRPDLKCKKPLEKLRCEKCNFETVHKSSIRKHIIRRHNEYKERTFRCLGCSYRTTNRSVMKEHCLMHKKQNLEKIKMKYSRRSFATDRQELLERRTVRRQQKLECDKCTFISYSQKLLRKHIVKHKTKLHCDKCTFTTYYEYSLNRHKSQRIKDREDCLRCDLCPFTTCLAYYTLKQHVMLLHNKTKSYKRSEPIQCQECAFSSCYEYSFRRHMLYVHKKEMEIDILRTKF